MSDKPVVKSPADWAFDGIDALVARCKRAEADADRLAAALEQFVTDKNIARLATVLHLHDEAVALR